MKFRPSLTVVASDLECQTREDDEVSCDIGETTLYKGALRINRFGVTFADEKHKGLTHEEGHGEGLPLTRKRVALDELETCCMIGRGCSGQVYKARHWDSNDLYAVKVVTNVFDKARRDQLLTEIRTLYDSESDHLVGFHGAYFQDHALSLVLEYCALGSLDHVLANVRKDEVVPERIVAAMALQLLMGLIHLKRNRHFHRDIKPQNILLQPNGYVKLTDFGLARELGSSTSMAQTFVGTFKYMAPERIQNECYDYKADVWSLGLVLIECATRTSPYADARSYIDVVQSIVESPEPALPEVDANGQAFTGEFHEFIARCLKKEPSERASVEELMDLPWLQLHNATSSDRSAQQCATWLQQLHLVDEEVAEAKESSREENEDVKERAYDKDERI